MIQIINYINKNSKKYNFEGINDLKFCVFSCERYKLMGIKLNNEFLVFDQKKMSSFRCKLFNLGEALPHLIFYMPKFDMDIENLNKYFLDNHDNPYGIYQFLRWLPEGKHPNELTQFPPLFIKKNKQSHEDGINRLCKNAEPGDTLFSYHRKDITSKLIRKYDWTQWNHCSKIAIDKTILETTITGGDRVTFDSYNDENYYLGLYRIKNVSKEERFKIARNAEKDVVLGYNWYGVFRLFLRNKFGISFNGISLSDLMLSNIYQLIDYI